MSRTRLPRARTFLFRRAVLRRPTLRRAGTIAAHLATIALLLSVPTAAFADPGTPVDLAANSLPVVIANLRAWIMGILAAVATLFLVLAGVYYATAGGDPAQVDKAKAALKNALVGYGLAVLAPILLQVVQGIVGKP
ncbi:pilin [Micromonospora sp. CPCC 205371]|nr:pilin [Micromonospora sp. CPCC 205371]